MVAKNKKSFLILKILHRVLNVYRITVEAIRRGSGWKERYKN